jgi:cyclopropane fatty-acyl-phospholipid synthase-like methyltransferase
LPFAVPNQDNWESHWQEYADSAAANPAQRYRRKLIFDLLALQNERHVHLLDIGSGQGDFVESASQRYAHAELLGLELSETGVAISQRKVPSARFLSVDLLENGQPAPDYASWATHAVCSEVLEHLERPDVFLRNVTAYLAPGCRLVVTVPGGPMSAFDRYIGHRGHFTPRRLRKLLQASGFRVRSAHGAGFPFFNLYRMVVLVRGTRLIHDVANARAESASFLARTVMSIFDRLFRFNVPVAGWQVVAVAEYEGGEA